MIHTYKTNSNMLLWDVIYCWRNYTTKRITYKYKLYGRICSLDVEAVKKMVRKDTINPLGLIKHALAVLFEFKGRGNYHDYQFFNQTVNGYFLTENYNCTQHREWDGIESDKIDMISYNIDRHNDVAPNLWPTYRDRIERKERLALRLLRFLLKQGCNPNDKTFIKNLVLKHNYHSKIFFIKILEMCYKYGLDENILLNILTKTKKRFSSCSVLYYISPVLDIHKNKLRVEDTINLCIGWSTKKNFLYTIQNYGMGDLHILNNDVIGVITSFIYFV